MYCPPRGPIDGDALHSLFSQLPRNNCVLGDINTHHYQWASLSIDGRGEHMADITTSTNFCLLINGRATRKDDCIGNFSANGLRGYFMWEPRSNSLGRDHFPTCLSYTRDTISAPSVKQINYRRVDWESLSSIASFGVSGETIDVKVENITQTILLAAANPKTSNIQGKLEAHRWSPDCR